MNHTLQGVPEHAAPGLPATQNLSASEAKDSQLAGSKRKTKTSAFWRRQNHRLKVVILCMGLSIIMPIVYASILLIYIVKTDEPENKFSYTDIPLSTQRAANPGEHNNRIDIPDRTALPIEPAIPVSHSSAADPASDNDSTVQTPNQSLYERVQRQAGYWHYANMAIDQCIDAVEQSVDMKEFNSLTWRCDMFANAMTGWGRHWEDWDTALFALGLMEDEMATEDRSVLQQARSDNETAKSSMPYIQLHTERLMETVAASVAVKNDIGATSIKSQSSYSSVAVPD